MSLYFGLWAQISEEGIEELQDKQPVTQVAFKPGVSAIKDCSRTLHVCTKECVGGGGGYQATAVFFLFASASVPVDFKHAYGRDCVYSSLLTRFGS
jgi:hypothetical protein